MVRILTTLITRQLVHIYLKKNIAVKIASVNGPSKVSMQLFLELFYSVISNYNCFMVLVYKGMMVNEFSHIHFLSVRWPYSANFLPVPQARILQGRCGEKLKILHYAFCTELAILCKMSADNTSPHE